MTCKRELTCSFFSAKVAPPESPPLPCSVPLEIQRFLGSRYGRSWVHALGEGEMIVGHTLYEACCRHSNCLDRVAPVPPPLSAYCRWPEQVDRLPEILGQEIRRGKKVALVQSNTGMPVSAYREVVGRIWKCAEV